MFMHFKYFIIYFYLNILYDFVFYWIFSFFMIRLELWVFGTKTTELRGCSHHVLQSAWLLTVGLDPLTQGVIIRFLHC